MITVEKGEPGLYRELFAGYTTLYTERCAENAGKDGRALYAYLDGEPAGYMFLGNDRGTELIHHTFTKPELRGRGVMQALVRYAVDSAGSPIGTSLSDSHEFAPAVMHVMEKCGFERRNGRSVYLCDGDDMWERWDAYMDKHGRRLCDTLRRQGFSTLTLDKASEDLLQQYRDAPDSEYKCQQNHQHLILPGAEITPDISVICTHNGRLAAYVFAYMADRKSVIFKTLSSSAALHGSGVIMLAIADAADIVRERGVTRLVFTMERAGESANAFREKVLSVLVSRRSTIVGFSLFPKTEEDIR